MANLKFGNTNIGKISIIEPYEEVFDTDVSDVDYRWERPDEWLDMPVISSGDRVVLLIAIPSGTSESTHYSFSLRGGQTGGYYNNDIYVDWGDGTTQHQNSYTADATDTYHRIYHSYNYDDIDASTEFVFRNKPHRQVIFSAVANSGYQYISIANSAARYDPDFSNYGNYHIRSNYSNILDMDIASSGATGLGNANNRNCHLAKINLPSLTSFDDVFYHANKLRRVVIPSGSTSNITTMRRSFSGCKNLEKLPFMDTSNVTTFDNCFNGCSSLKNIPLYDLSSCTNTTNMFAQLSKVKKMPNFDFSTVQNARSMFSSCISLSSLANVTFSDALTDCRFMFQQCKNLKSITITLDTRNALTDYMFEYCSSLLSIHELDMSSSTSFQHMFYVAKSLKELSITHNSPNTLTTLHRAFSSMSSLKDIKLSGSGFLNNTSLTSCYEAFGGTDITSAPYLDTPNCTNHSFMFSSCNKLKSVPLYDTSSSTSMRNMFYGCGSIENIPEFDFSSSNSNEAFFHSAPLIRNIPSGLLASKYNPYALYGTASRVTSLPENTEASGLYLAFNNSSISDVSNITVLTSGANLQNSFGATPIDRFPEVDGRYISNATSAFDNCQNFKSCGISGITVGIGFYNCFMSSGAITEFFNNLGTANGSQSIDLRGNHGAYILHPDTLAIATSKGWTVTT